MMLADIWSYQIGPDYWWLIVLKGVIIVLFLATAAAYSTYAERKVAAHIQLRIGPNRVGPLGLLQPAADAVKLLFKENVAPAGRDKLLYLVAPAFAAAAAIFAFAVIPVSGVSTVHGYQLHWDIAHLNVGLLYILAVTSLGVYAIFLGGWSANSKYSLLGALRSSAQLISYEMAVAFALMGAVILSQSLDLEQIVLAQHRAWFVLLQPLGFLLYFTGALAETNRLPFDLPEAETELVAGYHTEYSGMRFGFYFLGEYINMVTVCSIATVLFLGGWLPILPFLDFIPGVLWFLAKMLLLLFGMMWIRWTLPRLRYDRLMNLGWKVMLPLGLLNIAVTGAVVAVKASL
ncbi:MAG: nuoH [Chloroflexi bacterium]|jgi:NADH-quinone oxidoreductase subunit H|nr:nuoH [Chloroflexota bacterium]MEA2615081.1 NADH-quinone oxidoreductase subunit [Chloroflexota bacterium]